MKFNPLTDLTASQRDTAVNQLGGATGTEISNLASSVRTASQRTSQIVDLLRRDTKKTNSDLNKIMDLDRRLKTVIPIIPEKFGEAGNIFPDRQLIPEGGFQFPRIKFPKFPKTPPVRVPQPRTQPRTQTQTQKQKQKEKEKEKPKTREKPQWEWPWPPIWWPRRWPEGIPEFAVAKSFDRQLTTVAKDLEKFLIEKPGTAMAIDPTAGFGGAGLRGLVAISPTLLKVLGPGSQRLAQRLLGEGGTTAAATRLSTYGDIPIGPQPAPLRLPKPQPLRPSQVAPRTSQAQMDDLVKQLETPMSPQAEAARRQAFKDMPEALRAQQETLGSMVMPQSSLVPSPPGPIVRPAKEITKKAVGQSGTTVSKKTVDPNKLFGPYKYSASQIDDAIDVLKSTQGRGLAPPGTIGNYMQLNHPEVRNGFLDYLLSAKKGDGTPNYGLYEKILRQIGLLGDAPTQIDDEAFRFILNYHKKVGLDPDLLIKELLNKQLLPKETFSKYSDKISDVIRSSKMSPLNIKPLDVGPTGVPGNQPILPGGPQSSVRATPLSMDIASLGIDTSVEIQEIYYIVG